MKTYSDIALLAPVPVRHLQSGLEVCRREGKVAFGSMAFEFFNDLRHQTQGQPIPVYFYASHEEDTKPLISWQGIYTGYRNREEIPFSERNLFRPPTTYQQPKPDTDDWAVYWEVQNLTEIPEGPEQIPLARLVAYKGKKRIEFIPRGPTLIKNPAS